MGLKQLHIVGKKKEEEEKKEEEGSGGGEEIEEEEAEEGEEEVGPWGRKRITTTSIHVLNHMKIQLTTEQRPK